jgi:small-conductance mechanosensitive channel
MAMQDIMSLLRSGTAIRMSMVVVIVLVGLLAAGFISRSLSRVAQRHFAVHQAMLIKRFTYYLVIALTIITALNEAGINLSVVIGAAGVASVAIGFASQTSMSNLISGVFMIIEKPFMIGDTIKVGGTSGEVTSMGLLSTLLKTGDNVMVRIPNENLMKSEIANITRFETRKFEVQVGIDYSANLQEARELIIQAVKSLDLILKEPGPSVQFDRFNDNSMDLTLSCWCRQDRLADAKFAVAQTVKATLDSANISIPYPHRVLSISGDVIAALKQ